MRSGFGNKGKRSVLALLVTVALAFGLVPVGAFAFAATQTGASTEFASVDDMAADKGDAPDTEKKDVQAQGQGSAKTETTDSAQQQGAQQDEEATEPGNGTQAQEEQPGEQTLMVMSTSTANATGQEQTESEDPSDGDTQLYAQATIVTITYDVNGGTKGSAWPAGDLYEYVKSGTLMRFTAQLNSPPLSQPRPRG